MHVLGIDVGKAKLQSALLRAPAFEAPRSKSVPNTPEGGESLLDWATRQAKCTAAELHVILEATGPYHEPLALALVATGARVSIINPAQFRDFVKGLAVRTKTDPRDGVMLARYGAMVQPPPWQPPAPELRALRALLDRLGAVETALRQELNRLEKAAFSPLPPLVHESVQSHIRFLEAEKARLEQAIGDHIDRYPDLRADHALLQSIPAIGPKLAPQMLVVLRAHPFHHARQAAAFLSLTPVEHQSGSSVFKRPHLSKAGPARVRPLLYMAALVAIRYNPDVRALYQRLLKRGKTKMAAIGAAMRKLVHLCFGVLKNQTPYYPQAAL